MKLLDYNQSPTDCAAAIKKELEEKQVMRDGIKPLLSIFMLYILQHHEELFPVSQQIWEKL